MILKQVTLESKDSKSTDALELTLYQITNQIAVAKRMLIAQKFQFKHLPKSLQNKDGCLGFIIGLEFMQDFLLGKYNDQFTELETKQINS